MLLLSPLVTSAAVALFDVLGVVTYGTAFQAPVVGPVVGAGVLRYAVEEVPDVLIRITHRASRT